MKQTFEAWKAAVDRAVSQQCGMSADDLPDIDYYELYESGESPTSAAQAALENAGF